MNILSIEQETEKLDSREKNPNVLRSPKYHQTLPNLLGKTTLNMLESRFNITCLGP
jgi:hypothetical protein